jgi:hypothetical protein
MAFELVRRGKENISDFPSTVADGTRVAGDYDNSVNKDTFCDAYLSVEFDTGIPTAGDLIGELYVLYSDGELSPDIFPEGGDGTVGNDVDPQSNTQVGVFETRVPSLTVVEELIVRGIELRPTTCRFVFKNISSQTIGTLSELYIIPYKWANV